MDGATVETVTGWESEPLSGGMDGLRALADREFTGAVTEGRAWLFMLNGRVVGVADGSLDLFADADGTAYAAPDPSLPLLFAMRERGGETKARYYTNDTALSAADATLSSGSFTGYVELSENVLSGDYYAVYYAGRRLACAFVGTGEQKQVLTGDAAFEAADDEVGIYEVVDVDVDVVELPEADGGPEPEPDDGHPAGVGTDAGGPPDGSGASDAPIGPDAAGDRDDGGSDDPADEDDRAGVALGGRDPDPDSGSDSHTDLSGDSDAADAPALPDEPPSPPRATAANGAPTDGPESTDGSSPTGGSDPGDATAAADADVPDVGTADDGRAATADRRAGDRDHGPDAASDPDPEPSSDSAGDDSTGVSPDAADDRPGGAAPLPGDGTPAAAGDADASPASGREPAAGGDPEGATDENGDPFSAEEQWRETKSIPSLDPSRTASPEGADATADGDARRPRRGRAAGDSGDARTRSGRRSAGRADRSGPAGPQTPGDRNAPGGSDGRGDAPAVADEEATAESVTSDGSAEPAESAAAGGSGVAADEPGDRELTAVRAERDRAVEALREAREDREATEEELERLREENERLADRVDELESALAEAREEARAAGEAGGSGDGGPGAPGRTMPADRALEGTNLFVRYDSKGGATLSKAHAGGARRSEVNDNLRLEVHTDFEADDVTVDGRPYRAFLEDTIEYGFVEWAVRELLYEIQSTGAESGLRELFDAIPEIDRAELSGSVEVGDGEGGTSARGFDVVLRDRMGNPLVVADVTEGRDPTTEAMLDSLVGDAGTVGEATDRLAAAFHVTASFFEPGALEAAADATGGGLLSRGKRASFVKLARKQGFHLCLVESREGEFHVNVPEL